jgi:hypothetical protein
MNMEYMSLSLDEQVVLLCTELCGQYPFMTADYRALVEAAVTTMKLLCDQEYRAQIDDLLADAIDDARTGRIDAEIENLRRDRQRTEAAAQQNGHDE